MGQTLTHGVYLPDEGERNCYAGLAGNWQILDSAVGTIAEHTSQIAGKAPLVHIHTKSDITDLLNSNFIPSANNAYDLGSSSYQWNNLYAKNYYYNGVAWGLDKSNVWSANQTISNDTATLIIKNPQMTLGVTPASSLNSSLSFHDVNNTSIGSIQLKNHSNNNNVLSLVVKNKNGADTYDCALRFRITKNGDALLYPENAPCDLGSETLPFKTLNGVNPGALSLPNLSYSDSNKWIDLSGNITDETGGSNEYDPTIDGWVVIRANGNPTYLRVNVHAPRPSARKYVASATGVAIDGTMIVSVPAPAGSRVYIYFNKGSGSLDSATFITCQGNV